MDPGRLGSRLSWLPPTKTHGQFVGDDAARLARQLAEQLYNSPLNQVGVNFEVNGVRYKLTLEQEDNRG